MATVTEKVNKNGTISIKAIVRYKGVFLTKTFAVKGSRKRTTEREAFDWARNIEIQIDTGMYRKEEKQQNFTVSQAIEKYLKDGNPKNIIVKNKNDFIRILNWFKKEIGSIPIRMLGRTDLKACRDKLQKKYKEVPTRGGKNKVTNELISNSSINRYLAYFSMFLTYCVDEYEILPANPMIGAKLRLKDNEPRKRWLKELKERKALLDTCQKTNYELYLCVLMALCTGARKSEILKLTWQNTDLENKALYFLDTKNGDDRTIPIPNILFSELKKFKEQQKIRRLKRDFIFRTIAGKPNEHLIKDLYPKVVKQYGFEKITFHGLRHTYISIASLLGFNPSIIKKIVGHKFDSVTGGYTHVDCESLRKPMNEIANFMLYGVKENGSKQIEGNGV